MPTVLTADQAQAIAEEAYIYAYPIVFAYGLAYQQIVEQQRDMYQGLNRLQHFQQAGSAGFLNTIPWISNDMAYSASWLDLRAEPMVFSRPAFEQHRYQNVQCEDLYTHNFAVRGTRTSGNGPSTYLVAGPDWSGPTPAGVDEVLRSETQLVKMFARVVLEGPDDFAAIARLAEQCRLQPLSQFLGRAAPPPAPPIPFIKPSAPQLEARSLEFITYLNFVLQYCTIHPDETVLFAQFAKIGIGAGQPAPSFAPEIKAAIEHGIEAAHSQIMGMIAAFSRPGKGWQYPMDFRGNRDLMARDRMARLKRAAIARYAIWGPEAAEVVYMNADLDADGAPLDGSRHRYRVRFDKPPPARGFWSFTAYDAKTRCLVEHPSGKYAVRDRQALRYGADGSLTLYLQHHSPGADLETNWLPVPTRPFQVVARLYWPEPQVLDGSYAAPAIRKAV